MMIVLCNHPIVQGSRCAAYNPQTGPFIIGLTGGIASGKSSISKRMSSLGAFTVDCDKVRMIW